MKDSGIEWIGEIPEGWEVMPLKYTTKCNNQVLSEQTNGDTQICYIDIGSVSSDGNISDVQSLSFNDAPSRARRIVFENDTIISTVRTYLKAIAFISKSYNNFIVSTGFAVLTPEKQYDPRYLYYALRTDWFISFIESNSVGISYPAINSEKLTSLPNIVPPLQTQHSIASFLDTKCSLIDAAVEKERGIIEKLKEYRQAVITEAVTKGIRAGVPMKDSGIEWIGEIPDEWELRRLKLTVDLINEKTEYNGQTYIGLENIESGCGKYLETENQTIDGVSNSFSTGDILFGKLRPYLAKCIIAPFEGLCSSELLVIRNFKGNPQYLFWTLLSHWFINIVDASTYGAKMPRASWNFIRDLKICYPSLPTQNHIASFLDTKCSAIDATIRKRELAIEKLTAYKQSLIYECVTGKREVLG